MSHPTIPTLIGQSNRRRHLVLIVAASVLLAACGAGQDAVEASATEQALTGFVMPTVAAPHPLAPRFKGAALKNGSKMLKLFGVEKAQFVYSWCSGGPCMRLKSNHSVELDGVEAVECKRVGDVVECVLPSYVSLPSGAVKTVRMSKTDGGVTYASQRTFTAYRCRPDVSSVAAVVSTYKSSNRFLIHGTALWPDHPDASLSVTVSERAQGHWIATIPAVDLVASGSAINVRLDHPNLAKKVLHFTVKHTGCQGWRYSYSSPMVLKATTGTNLAESYQDQHEYRMPGASDNNTPLDISQTTYIYDNLAHGVSQDRTVVVGKDYSMRWNLLNRGSAPIGGVELEFTTSAPVSLGYTPNSYSPSGYLGDPQLRNLANVLDRLSLTCSAKSPTRYRCTIPSLPPTATWELLIPIYATGSQDVSRTVKLRAWGGGATEQYNAGTVLVRGQ